MALLLLKLQHAAAVCTPCLQVSLLPVLAAHQGTYHCYLSAWSSAFELFERVVKPLLLPDDYDQAAAAAEGAEEQGQDELQAAVWAVFAADVSSQRWQAPAVALLEPGNLESAAGLWTGSRAHCEPEP